MADTESIVLAEPREGKCAMAVSLRGVNKIYQDGGRPVQALRDVSVDFAPGKMHAIIGRSGAGKSTLLNMIAGIDRVTSGEVYVGTQAVHAMDEDALAAWRGAHVGVVYQTFELLPTLTLLENVLLPLQFAGRYDPRRSPQWGLSLLAQVGLVDHAHKRPAAISGGQSQRVAIARALVNRPALLVADEPTGNLDSATAEGILDLLLGLLATGMTVILATHDEHIASRADTLQALADGTLCSADAPTLVPDAYGRADAVGRAS
ncbi:MAG: ABC transporter ATP-binding protein [Anaerolineales bacterium]